MALDVEDEEEDEHNDGTVADQSGEDLDYSQSDAEEEEASDHEQAGPSEEQDWHSLCMAQDFDLLVPVSRFWMQSALTAACDQPFNWIGLQSYLLHFCF